MTTEQLILATLERIEARLTRLEGSTTSADLGGYTPEQWRAMVRNPELLRQMSRDDSRRRREAKKSKKSQGGRA